METIKTQQRMASTGDNYNSRICEGGKEIMKQVKNKILSILLCLSMVLATISSPVLANGETQTPIGEGPQAKVKVAEGQDIGFRTTEQYSRMFADRTFLFNTLPDKLKNLHYLCGSLSAGVDVTVEEAGFVYVYTQTEGGQKEVLEAQGFTEVEAYQTNLSEGMAQVPTSLMGKNVAVGERITYSEWGIMFASANEFTLRNCEPDDCELLRFEETVAPGDFIKFTIGITEGASGFFNVRGANRDTQYFLSSVTYDNWSGEKSYVVPVTSDSVRFEIYVNFTGTYSAANYVTLKDVEVVTAAEMLEQKQAKVILGKGQTGSFSNICQYNYMFDDRTRVFTANIPEGLLYKHYLRAPLGAVNVVVEEDGWVYALVRPDEWGQKGPLQNLGFVEIDSFTAGEIEDGTDALSLMAKWVVAGETISYGEWGVLIASAKELVVSNTDPKGWNYDMDRLYFDEPIKKGQILQFTIDMTPGLTGKMEIYGASKSIVFEDDYPITFANWSGEKTYNVVATGDSDLYDIIVRYDSSCQNSSNTVTLKNVKVLGYFTDLPSTNMASVSFAEGQQGKFEVLKKDALVFTDRPHVFDVAVPTGLEGKSFIQAPLASVNVTVEEAGWVYVLTQSRWGQKKNLENLGFSLVGNYADGKLSSGLSGIESVLMGKEVQVGDTISYDGWGVMIAEQKGWYNIEEYRKDSGYTAPTKEGYVFAGWYESEAEDAQPIGETVKSGRYYAKFVDEKVLAVGFQLSKGTNQQSESASLRMITTVDSLNYRWVKFNIYVGKSSTPTEREIKTVYSTLFGYNNDNQEAYSPTVFSNDSYRFAVDKINNIPSEAFGTEITIRPEWKTVDGTVVTGKATTTSVNDLF